ncbi:Bacterial Ig-like domain (group 2) [compost metagenome]
MGDTFDTAAFAKDISGAVHNVTSQVQYFSENPSLLQVDQQGNITGLNPGVAHVTAWYNGLKYTATVLVVKPYSAH